MTISQICVHIVYYEDWVSYKTNYMLTFNCVSCVLIPVKDQGSQAQFIKNIPIVSDPEWHKRCKILVFDIYLFPTHIHEINKMYAVTDAGFPGAPTNKEGAPTYYLAKFLPKTAWNNFLPRGGPHPWRRFWSATAYGSDLF